MNAKTGQCFLQCIKRCKQMAQQLLAVLLYQPETLRGGVSLTIPMSDQARGLDHFR